MELYDYRKQGPISFVFDARLLASAALFASDDDARPILAGVALVWHEGIDRDELGRIVPDGFVATDSYVMGLVGDGVLGPMELRDALDGATDRTIRMNYVLIGREQILKLKVRNNVQAMCTVRIGENGECALTTYVSKSVSYASLLHVSENNLAPFIESIACDRVVEGDYPRWGQLFPAAEPSLRECTTLAFNPDLLNTFARWSKFFEGTGKQRSPIPVVMRGTNGNSLKPCVFTMRVQDHAQLAALLMPVRVTDAAVEW
jgi:hypothetical protein